jgi:hypothetical protein
LRRAGFGAEALLAGDAARFAGAFLVVATFGRAALLAGFARLDWLALMLACKASMRSTILGAGAAFGVVMTLP